MRQEIDRALFEAVDVIRQMIYGGYQDHIGLLSSMIVNTYNRNCNVFICGNGGSHADALHFAEELTGRFQKNRKPIGALALGEACHTSCVGNDFGFDEIFARQLRALAKPGDVLIALSTSGDSQNVINAVLTASHFLNLTTFGLLGKTGGKLAELCTSRIIIPSQSTARIQEMHMMILHIAIEMTERQLFPQNYKEE